MPLSEKRKPIVERTALRQKRSGSGRVRMAEFVRRCGFAGSHANVKAYLEELGLLEDVIAPPDEYLLSIPEGQTKLRRQRRKAAQRGE